MSAGNHTPKIALLAGWTISLGSAFFAGKALAPQAADSRANQANATKSSNNTQTVLRSDGSVANTSSARSRLEAAPMVRSGSSKTEIIADIARHPDRIERANALLALIDTLAPDDFQEVVESFRELGLTGSRQGEYAILLSAWAKVNPTEALTYAQESTEGNFASNTILATWAGSEPDSAIAWANDNFEGEGANPLLVGIIRGLAPNDLSRATGLLESLPRSRERGSALNSTIQLLVSRDPEDAKLWAANIEEDFLRSGAYAATAEAIGAKNVSEAAQWLAETGDVDALNRVAEDLASDWYREDPEQSAAWVSTLPAAAMSEAAEGIVSNIVQDSPVEAAQWLSEVANSNPEANFDSSIRELVSRSAREDPELAAVWIGGLSNQNTQTRFYQRVLGDWRRREPAAAEAWVQNNSNTLPEAVTRRFSSNN